MLDADREVPGTSAASWMTPIVSACRMDTRSSEVTCEASSPYGLKRSTSHRTTPPPIIAVATTAGEKRYVVMRSPNAKPRMAAGTAATTRLRQKPSCRSSDERSRTRAMRSPR